MSYPRILEDRLLRAAEYGQEAEVLRLLITGIDSNTKNLLEEAPLHLAAKNGHELVVRLLIESGGDLTMTCGWRKFTPLHLAAENGHEPVVRLLLEKGSIADVKGGSRETPLHLAAKNGHEPVARLLIERGGDPTMTCGWQKFSPLHLAAKNGHELMVQLLLERGCVIDAKDDDGITPLHLAAAGGHETTFRFLMKKGADVTVCGNDGSTVMHSAAAGRNTAIIHTLLGILSSCTPAIDGKTPLHYAAQKGAAMVVRTLLENGAQVEARNKSGETALHYAAHQTDEATIRILLNNGARIHVKDRDGNTPLHRAISREAAVRVLLTMGADVSMRNKRGMTALHEAAIQGSAEVIQILLAKGADVDAKTSSGSTPLHLAVRHSMDQTFPRRLRIRPSGAVRVLLENGANPNAKDSRGSTVLELANANGSRESIQLLKKLSERAPNGHLIPPHQSSSIAISLERHIPLYSPSCGVPRTKSLGKELPLLLGSTPEMTCPDYGSDVNVITEGKARELGLAIEKDSKYLKSFRIGNGNIVRAIGRTKASCAFPNQPRNRFKCWFYVFAKLVTPVIMGMNFLDATETMTKHQYRLQERTSLESYIPIVRRIGSPRRRLSCYVNQQHVLANPDTGAEISMMSLSHVEKMAYEIDRHPESRGRVMFADGSTADTVGQVRAEVSFENKGGRSYPETFHVLADLSCNVLLGEGILYESNAFSAFNSSFVDNGQLVCGPFELNRLIWMGSIEKLLARSVAKLNIFSPAKSQNDALSNLFTDDQHDRDTLELHRHEVEMERIKGLSGQERLLTEETENRRMEQYARERLRACPPAQATLAGSATSRPPAPTTSPGPGSNNQRTRFLSRVRLPDFGTRQGATSAASTPATGS